MVNQLPDYFFRIRENGALVFRIDTENRQRRLELDQIASVNIKQGEFKPQGDMELTDHDKTAITDWIAQRQAALAKRCQDSIFRTVEHLNLAAHWANSQAEDNELEAVTEELLLAMHDLRSVLVRKKSQRDGHGDPCNG